PRDDERSDPRGPRSPELDRRGGRAFRPALAREGDRGEPEQAGLTRHDARAPRCASATLVAMHARAPRNRPPGSAVSRHGRAGLAATVFVSTALAVAGAGIGC